MKGDLTDVHRRRGMVLIPSATRRRAASVKLTSGTKTEQSMCTQPCPSVGLQARRNESGGGQISCVLRSVLRRGQSKQSGFYIIVVIKSSLCELIMINTKDASRVSSF